MSFLRELIGWDSRIGDAPNDALGRADPIRGERYSMPGDVGGVDHGGGDAELPSVVLPEYAQGMFVGAVDTEAAAVAVPPSPHQLRRRVDVPPSYQTPHEATHRRYEPPFTVAINQAAAGFTLVAPPKMGLHYLKVIAAYLTLDAAGTLRFVQGSQDGTNVADVSGNWSAGGANNGVVNLSPADISTPWFFTSPDQGLGIFTVTGKAQGFVTCCYSPYEA
jgi:hypothetical protein